MSFLGDSACWFSQLLFAMHGVSVSWKAGFAVCSNLGSFKKGAVKSTMPHMGQSSKMPNSPIFLRKSIVI